MKYTVTYSCSHTGTVQLYGKRKNMNINLKNTRNSMYVLIVMIMI